jgi:hypothetical protein
LLIGLGVAVVGIIVWTRMKSSGVGIGIIPVGITAGSLGLRERKPVDLTDGGFLPLGSGGPAPRTD